MYVCSLFLQFIDLVYSLFVNSFMLLFTIYVYSLFQISVCFSIMDKSTPEFDMNGAMEWNDGVGTLPGSQLKVCAQDP